MKQPCVYILANRRDGTLYVGVTSNLVKRVWEHKNSLVEGFTKRYDIHTLVWCEVHETMESAINREKRLKSWKRRWKVHLIEKMNPNWDDLYSGLVSHARSRIEAFRDDGLLGNSTFRIEPFILNLLNLETSLKPH